MFGKIKGFLGRGTPQSQEDQKTSSSSSSSVNKATGKSGSKQQGTTRRQQFGAQRESNFVMVKEWAKQAKEQKNAASSWPEKSIPEERKIQGIQEMLGESSVRLVETIPSHVDVKKGTGAVLVSEGNIMSAYVHTPDGEFFCIQPKTPIPLPEQSSSSTTKQGKSTGSTEPDRFEKEQAVHQLMHNPKTQLFTSASQAEGLKKGEFALIVDQIGESPTLVKAVYARGADGSLEHFSLKPPKLVWGKMGTESASFFQPDTRKEDRETLAKAGRLIKEDDVEGFNRGDTIPGISKEALKVGDLVVATVDGEAGHLYKFDGTKLKYKKTIGDMGLTVEDLLTKVLATLPNVQK